MGMLANASIVAKHTSFEKYLRNKAMRSLSGIVVIAVVMEPLSTSTSTSTSNSKYASNDPAFIRAKRAIGMDLCVLCRFMSRWNAFLSMFAEEAAQHMMNQFMLVSVVMVSCVFNALCHLSIVYS